MTKLVLGIIGFALAVLGILSKTTHEEGKGVLKRPTSAGWLVLILLVISLGLSLGLEWRDMKQRRAEARKEELWQLASARLDLLDQNVDEPICAFITELHASEVGDVVDYNALLFGRALNSAEDLIAHFDVACSPGGDWRIVGMFTKERSTKPCFSSSGICDAGLLFWNPKDAALAKLKIVDEWDEAINAASWMAGYSNGEEVARLTFYRKEALDGSTPAAHWRQLFGEAKLLFSVDVQAGLWLQIPLRIGEIKEQETETRISWLAASEPRIGLVQ